ncbi:hypothetical protein [Peribacillus frigoritolerans]|uniref:hypothetical protein n=1 Tax=Peribacillus frigoritolerans TaxID=450367 RepID=UPI003B8AA934
MADDNLISPNEAEIEFLNLAYNKFYDIYDDVFTDEFWDKDEFYRFSKVKMVFSIYAEIINYEPLRWTIKLIKDNRPPMEAEIASDLFKFIRNILAHFPFFDTWNSVWINSLLVNWYKKGLTIDKFLIKYEGHKEIKYRYWEEKRKLMTNITISFPKKYSGGAQVYLKDILTEKEGVKFALILMKKVLNTQVEEVTERN